MSPTPGMKTSETATPAESNYSYASNPFDLEDLKHTGSHDGGRYSPVSPMVEDDIAPLESSPPKAVKATRRRGMSQLPEPSEDISWQAEILKKSHVRGPSADTIQEQDALSNEIAKRQRAIHERLKAKLESEASTPSPTSEERTISGPFRGLEMLRQKSSRESLRKAADSIRSRSTSRPPGSRSNSRPATSRSVNQKPYGLPSAADSSRNLPESRRTSEEHLTPRDRKASNPPPISALNAPRSRSNSAQSNGRSISRNGRYRDEYEKAMPDGPNHRATTQIYGEAGTIPEDYPTPPMPVIEKSRRQTDSPQMGGLKVQTARSPIPNGGMFDNKSLYPPGSLQSPLSASSAASSPRLPIQSNALVSPNMSRGPSPAFPLSPAIGVNSARASPVPFMNNNQMATPPMSGNSTPVSYNFPSNPPPTSVYNRGRSASRKRSIQKSDIGEPRLISTTSVIDTVALPVGASLRNGMDEVQNPAPPLPAMNPLRRKFGLGRSSDEEPRFPGFKSTPYEPLTSPSYNSSSTNENGTFKPRHRLRKSSSEGEVLALRIRGQQQYAASNPALAGSRVIEGGMF
jgi:hypothetical protein